MVKGQKKLINGICTLDTEELAIEDLVKQAIEQITEMWEEDVPVSVKVKLREVNYYSAEYWESEQKLYFSEELKDGSEVRLWLYKQDEAPDFDAEDKEFAALVFKMFFQVLNHRVFAELMDQEKEKLDRSYKLAHIGTWEYDMIHDELHWSDITKEVHGFDSDYEPDVESTIQLFKEGYHRDRFAKAASDAIERGIPFDVELKIISGKGDERWIRATAEPEYENGQCVRFYGTSQNVTERRKAKEELEYNERLFKAMVQNGMDMMAILDEEANYRYISPAAYNSLSLHPDRLVNSNAFDFVHPEDRPRIYKQFKKLKPGKSIQLAPFRFTDADKNWRWLEATLTNLMNDPAVKGYISNARDITERHLKQEEILDSLKEKETLLAEIHHRIKNNLSGLIGMLQLQVHKENDEEVLGRLLDSVARIHTMASIHEQLYQTNNYGSIDLNKRLKLLARDIGKTYQLETAIDHEFQLEPLKLDVEQALPCSLIANEVLTNIHKHAFKGCKEGTITIELEYEDAQNRVHLSITDDGKGLPRGYPSKTNDSMGMTVVMMMADKLDAEWKLENTDQGARFSMSFEKLSK